MPNFESNYRYTSRSIAIFSTFAKKIIEGDRDFYFISLQKHL